MWKKSRRREKERGVCVNAFVYVCSTYMVQPKAAAFKVIRLVLSTYLQCWVFFMGLNKDEAEAGEEEEKKWEDAETRSVFNMDDEK